jgi:hypothetical protein
MMNIALPHTLGRLLALPTNIRQLVEACLPQTL